MKARIKWLVVLGALVLALAVQAVPAFADDIAPSMNAGQQRAVEQCGGCHGLGMVLPPR